MYLIALLYSLLFARVSGPFEAFSARYSSGVLLLRERDLAVMSLGRL